MQFLDRSGRARVVATAGDDRQLVEAVRQLSPDVVVARPGLVDPAAVTGTTILALDTRESIASLRHAIRVGAGGYFLWPGDRDDLAPRSPRRSSRPSPRTGGPWWWRCTVRVVVSGRRSSRPIWRRLSRDGVRASCWTPIPLYGDVSAAVGMPQEGLHTLADLAPMADELTSAHLDEALWVHPEGFGVLAGPRPSGPATIAAEALTHGRRRRRRRSGRRRRAPAASARCVGSGRAARRPTASSRCSRSTCCRSGRRPAHSRRSTPGQ